MISTTELAESFEQIGARVRLSPMGMDLRVQPADQPGIEIEVAKDHRGQHFQIKLNYTVVVDLRVAKLDTDGRELILVADDWGAGPDEPLKVFRCVADSDHWYVETETIVGS